MAQIGTFTRGEDGTLSGTVPCRPEPVQGGRGAGCGRPMECKT